MTATTVVNNAQNATSTLWLLIPSSWRRAGAQAPPEQAPLQHSLLAVQLMARIKDRFACRLSLASFLRSPTVEHLASLIPDSALTVIEGADHASAVADSDAVLRALIPFLSRQ